MAPAAVDLDHDRVVDLVVANWIGGDVSVFANQLPSPAFCIGDCDQQGGVNINELVRAVGIALDIAPLGDCIDADADGDGTVEINELVAAVNNALAGCPLEPQRNPAAAARPPPTDRPPARRASRGAAEGNAPAPSLRQPTAPGGADASPEETGYGLSVQLLAQASVLFLLPSSHSSSPSGMPLPHTCARQLTAVLTKIWLSTQSVRSCRVRR